MLHLHGDLFPRGGGVGNELLERGRFGVVGSQCQHVFAKLLEQLIGSLQIALERVEPLVIPAGQGLLWAAYKIGRVHVDGLRLPNAVQPADALLKQFRIERQIKEHEVMGKLKIATFAADLRANEQASAVWFGKPRGVAVALHKREILVKHRRLHWDLPAHGLLDRQCFFAAATNEQYLFLTQLMQ